MSDKNGSDTGILCVECKGRITADTQICPHCRAPVIRRYCSGCSQLVPDQTSFCPHCGTPAVAKRSLFKTIWKPARFLLPACAVAAVLFFIFRQSVPSPAVSKPAVKEVVSRSVISATPQKADLKENTSAPIEVITNTVEDKPENKGALEQYADAAETDLLTQGMRLKQGRRLAVIGSRLMQQHRYPEAAVTLASALSAFPRGTRDLTYGMALYRLGVAQRLSGQPDQAVETLQQAVHFAAIRSQAEREMEAAKRQLQLSKSNVPR